jgi:hypothetical protein
VSPVKYELGFNIPEDAILYIQTHTGLACLQYTPRVASGPRQPCHSLVEIPQNSRPDVSLHLRLGSLSVASYNSQGYGGGILTRLHGLPSARIRLSPCKI